MWLLVMSTFYVKLRKDEEYQDPFAGNAFFPMVFWHLI